MLGAQPVRHGIRLILLFGVLVAHTVGLDARPPSAVGTWVGKFEFSGTQRWFAFELQERADGSLLGYVLGGTSFRTVLSGRRDGTLVNFKFELKHPKSVRVVVVDGRIGGDRLTGTADDGESRYRVKLVRRADAITEQRFLFGVRGSGGELGRFNEVAIARAATGAYLAGGFAGIEGCDLWACDGGVSAFSQSDDGTALHFGLETDGGCSTGSTLDVALDARTGLYAGTYSFTDCNGTSSGEVIGGQLTETVSTHAASILAGLARIADDFESRAAFVVPHPAFSFGYLDYGETQDDVLASYRRELAAYDDIEADVNRVRLIHTVEVGTRFGGVAIPFGAEFDEMRTGMRRFDGERVTYLDTHRHPVRPRLRVWHDEKGEWVIAGNGSEALQLPFAFKFDFSNPAALQILPSDSSVDPLWASPGPFGTHFQPLTGHSFGDPKGNFAAFYARSDAELTDRGFFGEADGSGIRRRIPTYVAPLAGLLTSLVKALQATPSPYFDGTPHWQIELRFPTGERLLLIHLGTLARDLIERLSGAGIDVTRAEIGDDLMRDREPLSIPQGAELASPQVFATHVGDGFYRGGGTFPEQPWAQMEWFFVSPPSVTAHEICYFDHLDSLVRTTLQSLIDAQMADPHSPRYAHHQDLRWRWAAEGRLCMAYSRLPRDFSALDTNLGGWYEKPGDGVAHDEIVAFAPIATDTASFDSSLYSSVGAELLVLRQYSQDRLAACPDPSRCPQWTLPDGSRVSVFYPAGEVIVLASDFLIIRWRDIGAYTEVFQRANYLLDPDGLKIRWGAFSDTLGGASAAPVDASTPCDGESVVCYDHSSRGAY